MSTKYAGQVAFNKLVQLVKTAINGKVDKVSGKGLSTNDYTTAEKGKLAFIEEGAQVNQKAFGGIQLSGNTEGSTSLGASTESDTLGLHAGNNIKLSAGAVGAPAEWFIHIDADVPTKLSELENDAGFITDADIPEGAAASTAAPLMDGTAAVGVSNAFARGDHVHPSDTSKLSLSGGTMTGNLNMGLNSISKIRYVEAENVESQSVYTGLVRFDEQGGGVFLAATPETSPNLQLSKVTAAGVNTGNPVVVRGIDAPTQDTDAVNKWYLDEMIHQEISSAISGVYTPKGTVAFANLPAASASNKGWVYNISDAFTTTAGFVEGAGHSYGAGTNVVCVDAGDGAYQWDVLAGTIDLTELTEAEVQAIWDSI